MERKILFERFNENKKIYNLNEGYWKRKLNSRLEQKFSSENILFKNFDGRGKKIYDANPIFAYLDYSKRKAIRIIQDDIREISNQNLDLDDIHVLMSAWLDKIEIIKLNELEKVDELVIALILTNETVDKTMELIQNWLYGDLSKEGINRIISR